MSPIDLQVIEVKKGFLLKELDLLGKLQAQKLSKASDIVLKYAFFHSLQNAISAVIDIAQHIVSEKSGESASSYSDAIERLGQLGILEKEFAKEFSRAAKLRNVVVHLYQNVDIEFLASMLPKVHAATPPHPWRAAPTP